LRLLQQRTSDAIIDRRIFQGIVDLNDVDSTDFSTQMVDTYLAVATSTLADMDRAVCVSLHFLSISLHFTFTPSPPRPPFFSSLVRMPSYVLGSNRGNKDISKLSLLAVSLQDTSDAIGVTEVRRSCSHMREVIQVWSEAERKAGGAATSIDGIIAVHGRLKSDFALARSWLTRYVETGNVPSDDGVTMRGVVAMGADPDNNW
jgi:hypothetical protein